MTESGPFERLGAFLARLQLAVPRNHVEIETARVVIRSIAATVWCPAKDYA
jgi:hypothetical protein